MGVYEYDEPETAMSYLTSLLSLMQDDGERLSSIEDTAGEAVRLARKETLRAAIAEVEDMADRYDDEGRLGRRDVAYEIASRLRSLLEASE